jgi:anti-sigma B factor antagonist
VISVEALEQREVGNVLVVSFKDFKILDEQKIAEIGYELITLVGKTPAGRMLVNFEGVTFMSSAMIGKIIQLNKKCKENDVDLRLCSISPNVMEVFKLMRLHKVLNIQKDEEGAIKSYDKKGLFG